MRKSPGQRVSFYMQLSRFELVIWGIIPRNDVTHKICINGLLKLKEFKSHLSNGLRCGTLSNPKSYYGMGHLFWSFPAFSTAGPQMEMYIYRIDNEVIPIQQLM